MKVFFIAGYYSDLAHKKQRRPENYWDAYFFVWAVKMGGFKKAFSIHFKNGTKKKITASNIGESRMLFGQHIKKKLSKLKGEKAFLVPVPSKDGTAKASDYRSLKMLREAMKGTDNEKLVTDALRWKEKMESAHKGGSRSRDEMVAALIINAEVKGKDVVLVDDLLSTGASLLAAEAALKKAGANVLGAITCGRTIYDLETKPFGDQEVELKKELHDWNG